MSDSSHWLVEHGIGEVRAALVREGAIVKARIEPEDGALRVGAVVDAVLAATGRMPRLTLAAGGGEAMLDAAPAGLSIGRPLRVVVTRMALREGRLRKLPKVTLAPEGAASGPGPSLADRVAASGVPVRVCAAHQPDALEAAGWSEVLAEAASGEVAFAGGLLRIALTPAMTVIDVDGDGAADALAVAAAAAAGQAIVRLGIAGSIAIDFPTLAGKGPRQAAAQALDTALADAGAGPFERTAINGFGLLQLVRPRRRPSLLELAAADPVGMAARAQLRCWERDPPPGPARRPAPGAVARWLADRPALVAELHRRTGNAAPITDISRQREG